VVSACILGFARGLDFTLEVPLEELPPIPPQGQICYAIDGSTDWSCFAGLQPLTLSGIGVGPHVLAAHVKDAAGRVLGHATRDFTANPNPENAPALRFLSPQNLQLLPMGKLSIFFELDVGVLRGNRELAHCVRGQYFGAMTYDARAVGPAPVPSERARSE
jgi:hypothetical protein